MLTNLKGLILLMIRTCSKQSWISLIDSDHEER